jgi:lysyl-tRNA synthetase class 2
MIRRRGAVLSAIRSHLGGAGYLEVETPRLARAPIPESHIELFRTTFRSPAGTREELFLLPSPEYWLKQLLAAGSGNIFEIARCFRNVEEVSPYHRREFSMLEFYTLDTDAEGSIALTEELIRAVVAEVDGDLLDPEIRSTLRDSTPYPTMSMADAFYRFAGIELESHLSMESLSRAAREMGMRVSEEEGWEDLFQRLFLTHVEPQLPTERPLFLTDYPAAIPTLARQKPGTPWADRWELYFRGQEVANCYGEETNPEEIALFMADEAARKQAHSVEPHPVDPGFLQRPGQRLPRCSGVALGVDRLIMTLADLSSLDGVIYFPISDIVGK